MFQKYIPSVIRRKILKSYLTNHDKLKIIIGAGNTKYNNWIATDYPVLNILNKTHWDYLFAGQEIHNVLSEHVFEHLTIDELLCSLSNISLYASPDIVVRIAVPDGNFPDSDYIDHVKPGGIGPGATDHKVLYTKEIVENIFAKNDTWEVEFVEYWTTSGTFHSSYRQEPNGYIQRSRSEDWRNTEDKVLYTSLIFDLTLNV